MTEYAFVIKDNKLYCFKNDFDKETKIFNRKKVKMNDALNILDSIDITKDIRFYYSKNDIVFKFSDYNVRLVNYKKFKNVDLFNNLFKIVKSKKFKIDKNKIIYNPISIILATTILLTPVIVNAKNKKDKEKINTASTTNITYCDDSNSLDNDLLDLSSLLIGSKKTDEKVLNVKKMYGDIISKYSNMYGVDYEIMCAIATQERGIHSSVVDDSGAIGLFQLEYSIWTDPNTYLYVINYDTGKQETIHTSEYDLGDLETNCKFACANFQYCMRVMHNNELAAMQCYNLGTGSMQEIISNYAESNNLTYDEVLNNKFDIGWLNYILEKHNGDPNYLKHSLRYYGGDHFTKKIIK